MTESIVKANENTVEIDEYVASNYSSMTLTNAENKKLVANAVNAAESLADMEGLEIEVVGVLCRPGVRKARGANQADAPCTDTILVCDDGSAYFSKSEGVRRAVDNFMALGIFDDGEPVKMHLETIDLGNGMTMKTLVLD